MQKEELISKLHTIHSQLNDFIIAIDSNSLNQRQENNKWSIAEEIGHLINSLQQSNKGITLPKFFLKYKFGTNNRQEKTYDELVAKYLGKLATNPLPNNPFQLKEVEKIAKEKLLNDYIKQQNKFEKRISKFTEKELSTLLLPHPLLGKLTLREFGYFTHYHTLHHFENCSKKLTLSK
jgi:hypothetical protein